MSQSRIWSLDDAGIGEPSHEVSDAVIPNGSPRSRFKMSVSEHDEELRLSMRDRNFDRSMSSAPGQVLKEKASEWDCSESISAKLLRKYRSQCDGLAVGPAIQERQAQFCDATSCY